MVWPVYTGAVHSVSQPHQPKGFFMLIELYNSDKVAIIDNDDYELIKPYSWCLNYNKSGLFYSYSYSRINGKKCVLPMHRLILNAPTGMLVDHINRDGLDNRVANLRLCSHSENMANRKMSISNKTGVRGVYIDTRNTNLMYRADVSKDGIKHRKSFSSLEEAKQWVRYMSMELHGEFACMDGLK
jgi:hypothetical protein